MTKPMTRQQQIKEAANRRLTQKRKDAHKIKELGRKRVAAKELQRKKDAETLKRKRNERQKSPTTDSG